MRANSWLQWHYLLKCKGSCLAIMRAVLKDGLNEDVIAVILRSTVGRVEQMQKQGEMDGDVKALNLLIQALGRIALSDFGVSGLLIEIEEDKYERRTFIETRCCKIDIWAIGITAIELGNGKVPLSDLPRMIVLTMILKGHGPMLSDNEVDNESDSSDSSSDCDSDSDSESDDPIQKQKKQKTAMKLICVSKPNQTSGYNLIRKLNDDNIDDRVAEDGQSLTSCSKVRVQKHIQSKLISNSKPFSSSFKDFVQQCLQTYPMKKTFCVQITGGQVPDWFER
ncbi:MAG: putative Serine/threonine-protein kinase fray2 [Streblomastix strix]|uniref:Putative Serine/threonine-protein kinase fray2 n=1 Tax=Streblomastix strix TaxID=222440 RepID=A0A5J4VG70_9EUKA|nr:MAG: putative Serine/threonine-protein kinase fray2 [Streblomastix strix]